MPRAIRVTRGMAHAVSLGGSSNGRTTDSGSVYLGSNPSPPASHKLDSFVGFFKGPIV